LLDVVSHAYVVAGLRIGRELEGFVDAYYGPDEPRGEAESIELGDAIDKLDEEISRLPQGRRKEYLQTQARAMRSAAAQENPTGASYRAVVEDTFDIWPELVDESVFEAAHRQLDYLLPGDGPVAERLIVWRDQFKLPADQALGLAQRLASALRELTLDLVDLPDGEGVEIRLVSNQPWSGYNWYLGGLQSRIEINTDLPIRANVLPELVAHEMYCGHHTEHMLKEHHLYQRQGLGETSIALLTSPQAIVSEGIATNAFDILVPKEIQADWLDEHCYRPAGLDLDTTLDIAIRRAAQPISRVAGNAALLLHEQGWPEEDIVHYVEHYGLRTEQEARQSVRFMTTPILRGYIFTYTAGRDLVRDYLERADDRFAAFRSLLTEHWTPRQLREAGHAVDQAAGVSVARQTS
jgi:hypothetical protein